MAEPSASTQVSAARSSVSSAAPEPAVVASMLSPMVYRSRAATPLTPAELLALTTAAQSRNRTEEITGLVLYDDDCFFQWLEGPADSLGRIMHSIRNDPRHTDIEVLTWHPSPVRVFGDWTMKLATPGPSSAPWYGEVLEPPPDIIEDLRRHPDDAPSLLVKLVSRAVGKADTDEFDGMGRLPLGRNAASVLKSVFLSVVVPELANHHGVSQPSATLPPIHPRARELVDLLIAADQDASRQLITELVAADGSIWPLYTTLFEPAARRLGDLWAEDLCSDFDVTLALCRIQTAARLLGTHAMPRLGRSTPGPMTLIAPEPGELHRLGAALDSEVLWNAGWAPRCEYPTTDKALQDLLATTWFDALDVTLSTAFRREDALPDMAATIAGARRASRNPALVVLVGGRIFVEQAGARAAVGADIASPTSRGVDRRLLEGLSQRKPGDGSG